MPNNDTRLIDLALKEFGKLLPAEYKVLRAAANGKMADCRTDSDSDADPADADSWGPDRIVRARLIRWLCIDRQAHELVDVFGLRIAYARIANQLDLESATIPFRVGFDECRVVGDILLRHATLFGLYLVGSYIQGVAADALQVTRDIFMRSGVRAEGEVRLLGAKVGGNLDCSGSSFINNHGSHNALSADGIEVSGNVFLADGFRAKGGVRLLGAKVGGSLACRNGSFIGNDGNDYAIAADGVEVIGNIHLDDGFQAKGEVRLLGARVGANLACDGGSFKNSDGDHCALNADGIQVTGTICMRNGFEAEGEVRLLNAKVQGNVECDGGSFRNNHGDHHALVADGIEVTGCIYVRDGFQAEGEVRFSGAVVGGDLACCRARFANIGELVVLRLDHASIAERLILTDGTRLMGPAAFMYATVGTLWDEAGAWPAKGQLHLDGLKYRDLHGPQAYDVKRRLDWLRLQPDKPFKPQPYEQLARMFRERGHEAGAKRILIAKEQDRRRHGNLSWLERIWSRFLGAVIAYGYRPFRAVLWGLGFVVLGTLLFALGDYRGWMAPTTTASVVEQAAPIAPDPNAETEIGPAATQPTTTPATQPAAGQTMNPIAYSVDAFLPIVNLHQQEFWLPDATSSGGRLLRAYLYVHILAGWGLTTLAIAGFTGLVRRQSGT